MTILRRRILQGILVLPALGATAASAVSGADLPQAVDLCLRRMAWLDRNENTADFSDERWDEEFDAQGVVWERAIAEPSVGLKDLSAKARLALDDLDRFHPETLDGSEPNRLLRVLLREVITLCA